MIKVPEKCPAAYTFPNLSTAKSGPQSCKLDPPNVAQAHVGDWAYPLIHEAKMIRMEKKALFIYQC